MAAVVLLWCSGAFADDVTDSINEALEYYNAGRYSEAVGSLNYAAQIIGQKKGGQLEDFLPPPPGGVVR
jgi:hypothetical protein